MARWRLKCASVLVGLTGISGGCGAGPPCVPPETIQVPAPQAIPSVAPSSSVLEYKVKVQEKRIAELSMQLRMLKHIDLDRNKE